MRRGIVQYYLKHKGYGYIRDPRTREEFFFMRKHLQTEIYDKAPVRFAIGENRYGLFACNIQLDDSGATAMQASQTTPKGQQDFAKQLPVDVVKTKEA